MPIDFSGLEYSSPLPPKEARRILFRAASGDIDVLDRLQASLNALAGEPAVLCEAAHRAVRKVNLHVARMALRACPDGVSCFMRSYRYLPSTAAALIGHGGLLKIAVSSGRGRTPGPLARKLTPLMAAAYFGELSNVKYLLAEGFDARAKDRAGRCAACYAILGNNTPACLMVLDELERAGADLQSREVMDSLVLGVVEPEAGNPGLLLADSVRHLRPRIRDFDRKAAAYAKEGLRRLRRRQRRDPSVMHSW